MRSEWLGLNLSQRETAKQSGSAFPDYGDATYRRHAYDARGELVSAWAYLGSTVTATTSPLPGRKDDYAYDSIGNRKWANRSGNAGLKESFFGDTAGTAEGANALNQCLSKENDTLPVQGTVDAAGTAVVAGVTAPVAASRQGRYWAAELEVANGSGPWSDVAAVYTAKVGGGTGGADLIGSLSRPGLLGAKVQSFTYDNDGNLTGDGIWNYSWDAENRLIRMETTAAAISAGIANRVLEFRYDSMHRRVQKRVLQGATSAEISSRRYLYDGWNLLAEFTAPGGNSCGSVVRSYTWGLDLAGSLAATGGVGALLQIRDEAMDLTLLAAYDGNGNVAALVDHASGAIQAAYEYDPFGQLLRAEGNYARHNPYRFSTRFHDVDVARQRGDGPTGRLARRASRAGARMGSETRQTGLAYYGRRFYSPALGRFISRDPIEESGGLNLYGFVGNNPANAVDRLGLDVFVAWGWGYWDWLGGGVDDLYGPRGFSWGLVAMEDFGPVAVAPRFPDRIAGTGLPAGPLPRQPYSRIALNRTKSPTDISVASRLFNDAPNNTGYAFGGRDPFGDPAEEVWRQQQNAQLDAIAGVIVNPVGQPGMLEGVVPIWGSGRASIDDYQNGRWIWGTINAGMAVSDILLIKAAITAGGKLVAQGGVNATRIAIARALGKEGERRVFAATGYVKNTTHIRAVSGTAKYRVPDILDRTKRVVGDVKNVASQDLDDQLRDILAYAKKEGFTFELWTRSDTVFGPALAQAIANGEIAPRVIPGL